MTTNKNRFEHRYVVGCLIILTAFSLLFQNCSPLKSQGVVNTTTAEIDLVTQTSSAGKLTWAKNSGTVSPDYQYSIIYTVNFSTKNLKITVTKGTSVTGLVAPADKTISDTQLTQIKSLIGKIKSNSCKTGEMLLGGGSESIGIYSSATRTSPETVVYGSDCTGLSSSFFQASSGFSDLTTYLKSL